MHFNAISHGSMNSIFNKKIYNIFLISDPNIDYGCLLETAQWGGFNEHPQYMFVETK